METKRKKLTLHLLSHLLPTDTYGEELHVHYFNYQFVNHAGVQIEVSFTEFGRPEKVTLDVDDVLNWLRIFRARSAPSFVLKANIKSNDVPIKINGEDSYRMVPSTQRDEVFVIDISVKGIFTLVYMLRFKIVGKILIKMYNI